MSCKVEQVVDQLKKLEGKNVDISELKAQVDKKIAEKQSSNYSRKSKEKDVFINHTGGAYGADSIWADMFRKYGVINNHYRPINDKGTVKTKQLKDYGDNIVPITELEAKQGLELNKKLGNTTHDMNNRNYVQVVNADTVLAVAPIVNNKVTGGTGSAVRMAEHLGKEVYVLDTETVKWYKSENGKYVPINYLPKISNNFAAVGTRGIESYTSRDKNGNWVKTDLHKNTKAILELMQNTVAYNFSRGSNNLKWDDKNSTIVSSDGKTKVKVNTLDELTKLSEEYHDLLTSKLGSKNVDFKKHKEYFLGLFKQLENAGIKFKPITVHFNKTIRDGDLGKAYKTKNEIELSTSRVFENRYPLKIALQEYAHILTMNELDKYPHLAKRVEEIMDNVLQQFPDLAKEYGFTDKYEFIAEVISSPRFQSQLAAAKSDGKSNIVDRIRKIFNYLLSKVNASEVNALTDALEVVAGLTNLDIKNNGSKEVYTTEQELANTVNTVNKNKPFYKHYIEDSVMGKVYPHTMLDGETIYVPAGNTGFYYDSSKKRVDVQSTGSSMQAKLNDAVSHIKNESSLNIKNKPIKVYHGTNVQIDKFDNSFSGGAKDAKLGHYFTSSFKNAVYYGVLKKYPELATNFEAQDDIISDIMRDPTNNKHGIYIIEAELDIGNHLVEDYKGKNKQFTDKEAKEREENLQKYDTLIQKNIKDGVEVSDVFLVKDSNKITIINTHGKKDNLNSNTTIMNQVSNKEDNVSFDKNLHNKLEKVLKKLYPEIKLEYTENEIQYEDSNGNVMNQEEVSNIVKYSLKVAAVLYDWATANPSKYGGQSQPVVKTIRKSQEAGIRKRLAGKGVSKEQIDFMFEFMDHNDISEIGTKELAEKLLLGLAQNVEVMTATKKIMSVDKWTKRDEQMLIRNLSQLKEDVNRANSIKEQGLMVPIDLTNEIADRTQHIEELQAKKQGKDILNTTYYQDLTVPGGINYKEMEISTPNITAKLVGHAKFATSKGIGRYRVDEAHTNKLDEGLPDIFYGAEPDKTLRVLEMQSDMFQKMKDKDLTESNKSKNLDKAFHQILNTDNKWVKFFIKSIVQNAERNGYKKIKFPSGKTVAKVEEYTHYDDKNREAYNYNKTIDAKVFTLQSKLTNEKLNEKEVSSIKDQINSLNNRRKNVEGHQSFGVMDFYDKNVRNILIKEYGSNIVKTVTDEYGNSWFELELDANRDSSVIMLQRQDNRIKGQANIKAGTVLINSLLQSQDTLPHEYAHHYIAWFRETPIVKEAIKKWGSEEALVQAIGEQAVKQKGEAWNWWKKFTIWLQDKFNKLDKATKEELKNVLTDAFLTRKDLSKIDSSESPNNIKVGKAALQEGSNSLLVPLDKPDYIKNILDKVKGFTEKEEIHLTVLGFPQGKELKTIFEENPEKRELVEKLIEEADFSYTPLDEVYRIERDREAWVDWKDQSKGKETIHEEAIIQLVKAPGVEKFIKEINTLLGTNFPVPFPHIRLGTKGNKLGIGLADKKAFDAITKEKIDYKNNTRGSDETNSEFGVSSDELIQNVPATDLGKSLTAIYKNFEMSDRSTETSTGEESASLQIKSQEFMAVTEHILQSFQKNLKDLGKGTISMELFKNEDLNTSGSIDLDTKKMSLRYNRMSRTARISEIFLHEVNHLISADVFANNPRLRRLMNDLRQATLDSGIDYKVFLDGIDNPTSEEIEIAKRKFDYVFDSAADPEEFYAYATTNEAVYNAVKDITVHSELIKSSNTVDTRFQKIIQRLIDLVNKIWSQVTGRAERGNIQIIKMIAMIDNLAREKAEEIKNEAKPSVNNRVKNVFNKIDEKVNPIMDKIEAKSKSLKLVLPSTKMLNKIMDLKAMRDIAGSGAVQFLIREVTKDTTAPEFAEMYQITRKTKQVVERATNQIKVGVEDAINEMFKGETDSTKKAITHVMFDLDLGHLLDTMNKDGVVDMILDSTKRATEIAKVEAELEVTKYAGQIDGLAEYIVSGNTIMMNQQINANNIVEYINKYPKTKTKTYKDTRKHIALVDKLVSLKALDKISSENKALVQEYLAKEGKSDVLIDSLTMYKNYMDQMKKDAQTSQYDPIKKGYTQAPASLVKYSLIPEDQVKAQLSVNMHLESTNVYVTIAGKNYYLMTGKIKSVGFNEGALGMISNTLDGVSISSLMRDRFEEIGFGVDKIDEKIEKLVEDISTGKANGRQFNLGEVKSMIPVHDKSGKIVDYRIQLNKIDRIEMLKEEEDVAKVLAHTYARADKLVRTAEQNRNVVDTVIRQSAVGMAENPEDYVVIEEYTKEDKEAGLPYTKLHERWDRIPDYTKDYIRKQLGVSKLPIHKDFVELITGEKQMTLGNFNYFGLDMKQHPIARARIMALESWVKELLAYVKQTTVILNGSVVMGNTVSNMITAAVHGVDPITYISEVKNKWILLNEYNELERKLAKLNVDKMAGKDVDRKIRQLEDQKVRHPYHALVEDGQFSPIVDDINVNMETNGQLATMLKDVIDKTKLGRAIHPVIEFAYLDKKTRIYKTMLKVTQYGDAITRQIILEKNVAKREAKLGKKLTREEYQEELNYVDQLLINYGYVSNRVWDWMEKVAGLNFMKYYLRNIKATYKMFNRNKSATMFEIGSQYLTGVDFSDSMDAYAKNPIVALTNRFMLDDVPSELTTPHIFGLLPDFSSIVKFH